MGQGSERGDLFYRLLLELQVIKSPCYCHLTAVPRVMESIVSLCVHRNTRAESPPCWPVLM